MAIFNNYVSHYQRVPKNKFGKLTHVHTLAPHVSWKVIIWGKPNNETYPGLVFGDFVKTK